MVESFVCVVPGDYGVFRIMDISKIYPTGVPKSGIKNNYDGRITKLHKRNVAAYALDNTIALACKKYNVKRITVERYIIEFNKGDY